MIRFKEKPDKGVVKEIAELSKTMVLGSDKVSKIEISLEIYAEGRWQDAVVLEIASDYYNGNLFELAIPNYIKNFIVSPCRDTILPDGDTLVVSCITNSKKFFEEAEKMNGTYTTKSFTDFAEEFFNDNLFLISAKDDGIQYMRFQGSNYPIRILGYYHAEKVSNKNKFIKGAKPDKTVFDSGEQEVLLENNTNESLRDSMVKPNSIIS